MDDPRGKGDSKINIPLHEKNTQGIRQKFRHTNLYQNTASCFSIEHIKYISYTRGWKQLVYLLHN